MAHIDGRIAELLAHPFYSQTLRPWGGRSRRRWVAPTEDGCLVFVGAVNSKGYGTAAEGLVHRLAWQAFYGPIPAGMELHHRCRVKTCCRVDHLVCLTKQEHRELEARPQKLNSDQVIEILGLLDAGMVRKAVADRFGVSVYTVADIRAGRTWRKTVVAYHSRLAAAA
jgi:hypothetical protein